MAADTFNDAWTKARLYLPAVPPMLVRDFCQDAYTRACSYRDWGFLRGEGTLSFLAARSISVGVIQGSTAVTSAALFVATDLGRQFRVGTSPVYTVVAYTDTSNITLDRAYAASTDAAATAQILDLYVTTPVDFSHFIIIADPYYQRPIPFWISQDQIGLADPARTVTDTLRYLCSFRPSVLPSTLGQMQYEAWPAPTSARQYPYLYQKQAGKLTETSVLTGVFANRADLLKLGAQMCAAEWPGSNDLKNPYFNPQLAVNLTKQWEYELNKLSLADDDQYPQDLQQVHWDRYVTGPVAPGSWLRQTDATLDDYL